MGLHEGGTFVEYGRDVRQEEVSYRRDQSLLGPRNPSFPVTEEPFFQFPRQRRRKRRKKKRRRRGKRRRREKRRKGRRRSKRGEDQEKEEE